MTKTIKYDESKDEFVITLHVPKHMEGTYTYDPDITWQQTAVCVFINNSHEEYTLSHTQYLDYKDSLQATQSIIYFDTQKEAEDFAHEHGLMIEYSHNHDFLTNGFKE
jgi:hypothetical protein